MCVYSSVEELREGGRHRRRPHSGVPSFGAAKGLEVGHEDQFLQRVMLLSQQLSSARDASAKDASKKSDKNTLLAQTSVSSMIVSLATQAVQLRSLLSYTQERELTGDASSTSTPLELEPEFLGGLAHPSHGSRVFLRGIVPDEPADAPLLHVHRLASVSTLWQ